MISVRKTSGGHVYIRSAGRRFDVGDTAEVSESEAAYLCDERGDFEVVKDGAEVREEDGPPDVVAEGDDFSSNGWLDNGYQDRADAVHAGGLDEYLDEIEEVETSQTVIDAVEDRRDELEG